MSIAAWKGGMSIPACATQEKNISVTGTASSLCETDKNSMLTHCAFMIFCKYFPL